jgi:hypothetical protein
MENLTFMFGNHHSGSSFGTDAWGVVAIYLHPVSDVTGDYMWKAMIMI